MYNKLQQITRPGNAIRQKLADSEIIHVWNDDIRLDSTSIHQIYDSTSTRLRLESFSIPLETPTPVPQSLMHKHAHAV